MFTSEWETSDWDSIEVNESVFVKEVQVRGQEFTDWLDALACLKISDRACTFGPVDEQDVEIVESQQLARRFDFNVTRRTFGPAMNQHSQWPITIERTLKDWR